MSTKFLILSLLVLLVGLAASVNMRHDGYGSRGYGGGSGSSPYQGATGGYGNSPYQGATRRYDPEYVGGIDSDGVSH